MPTLKPGPGYIDLDDTRIPLISGEFHFWRIQKSNWRAILERIRELGVNVVSTYVCWDFHQVTPDTVDLTGQTTPQHDFQGFLELTREMGFYLMVRPGPYIYSEWKNGGVTDEAATVYRLSDRFAELSRPWIEAVASVIVPFQATRGGHVILLQPDNEPYPAIPSRGAEIGCYREPGLFKEWMARRYDEDIDKLNRAWRTDYKSFDEVCIWYEEPYVDRSVPINGRLCPAERFEQRVVDSQD
ncbi:MAG: beta-galactosidase, partial [Planctomycetota bacterium]